MNCFIDDYNIILIESNDYLSEVNLNNEKLKFVKKEANKQYFKSKTRIPLQSSKKIYVNNLEYSLKIGLVTLKPDFNETYKYDGQLGNIYSKDKTIFRVFSPVASEVFLVINNEKHLMNYNLPIWEIVIEGDLNLSKYHYIVNINDRLEHVVDPYAKAGNDENSIVIDLKNTYQMKEDFNKVNIKDMIIYEGHIRDLTVNLNLKNKKNYLGLIEKDSYLNQTVLDYIKDINMTHLQLLPVQDFYEVSEIEKDKYYNWGYNPKSYFTLTNWYSSNYNDPYSAINEFKQVIDYAHSINLGINLDVVYNHVYKRSLYPYDKLVPGYFYRHDKNYLATDSSLVGNDIETRNYMVRKLIVDSLVYLTEEFRLDGYRFDLMGLMDIDTMLLIEKELKKINPYIKLYGEGWNIPNLVEEKKRSNMANSKYFPNYAHFNDFFRDTLKGNQYNLEKGYLAGNNNKLLEVLLAIKGSSNIFKDPLQSINYIDCHDNLTYHDYLVLSKTKEEHIKYYLDFANHFVAITKGIPFYQAGSEFYRSKKLENNTYNLDDSYNGIVWDLNSNYLKLKEILEIRNKYSFNDATYSTKIEDNLIRLKLITKDKDSLYIYLKNDFKENIIETDYNLIFSSYNISDKTNYLVDKPGVFIFKK